MVFSKSLSQLRTLNQAPQWINARDRLFRTEQLVQAGKTPFEVIYDDGLAKLRHYPASADCPTRHRVPLVIVAPLAINMLVYDLFEHRSLIRYLTNQGFSVYLIDWGKPTRRHVNRNFHSYILSYMPAMLREARQHSGQQQLSLHGWSMAGIFTLLYAAHSQDPDLKNIIILGSPIDSYASGNIGRGYQRAGQFFQWMEQQTGWHPRTLPAQLLHSPGWSNALGFKLLDPVGTMKGH
ncbi:MAG: alpha/beta fold hydrolase, partial [Pseudomonadota bacterium]|nr:alpha/beta fold hydrolase [Pseudomonadota bacterium]